MERVGASVDELAANKKLLTDTIALHRREVPEAFLAERKMRAIGKMPAPKQPLERSKSAMAQRHVVAGAQERAVAGIGDAIMDAQARRAAGENRRS